MALDLNLDKVYSFDQLQIILSNIGQNRSYFLLSIPPIISQQIYDFIKSKDLTSDQKNKLQVLSEKIITTNSIIKKHYKSEGFVKDVLEHSRKDKRLKLAISNSTKTHSPIKKYDDIDIPNDFNGPSSYRGSYEFNSLWPWLEFYIQTSGQVIILSANNEITDGIDKITRFGTFLKNLLEKIQGTLCKKITIYTVEKDADRTQCFTNNDLFEKTMKRIIGDSRLPEFGIKFLIVSKKDKKRIHSRRLITNHIYMKLDDDLGGYSDNKEITIETEPKHHKEILGKYEDYVPNPNPFRKADLSFIKIISIEKNIEGTNEFFFNTL